MLRAGQSPFEPRLVTVPDGLQTGREPHPSGVGQPRGESSAGHLDRVWPDTDPEGKSLVAAKDVERRYGPVGHDSLFVSVRRLPPDGAMRAATCAWNGPDGGVRGGPEYAGPVELQDPLCFLAGGRSDQTASCCGRGDQNALRALLCAWGLLCRAGRPGVLLPVRIRPRFPWGSLVFLFCSFWASAGGLNWVAGNRRAAFAQVRDLPHWSG